MIALQRSCRMMETPVDRLNYACASFGLAGVWCGGAAVNRLPGLRANFSIFARVSVPPLLDFVSIASIYLLQLLHKLHYRYGELEETNFRRRGQSPRFGPVPSLQFPQNTGSTMP